MLDLENGRPKLIVSLVSNDPDLARIAIESGADGLKTHISVSHRASGTMFGSLQEELGSLESILSLGAPTGLVLGGQELPARAEVEFASTLGFVFFDLFLRHAPGWYVDACGEVPAAVALAHDDPLQAAEALGSLGIRLIEASLVPPEEYGTPLHFGYLATYARLVELAGLPVLIPTQHHLLPEDVPSIVRTGARGLVLGSVVTGRTQEGLAAAVESFRRALDSTAGGRR